MDALNKYPHHIFTHTHTSHSGAGGAFVPRLLLQLPLMYYSILAPRVLCVCVRVCRFTHRRPSSPRSEQEPCTPGGDYDDVDNGDDNSPMHIVTSLREVVSVSYHHLEVPEKRGRWHSGLHSANGNGATATLGHDCTRAPHAQPPPTLAGFSHNLHSEATQNNSRMCACV